MDAVYSIMCTLLNIFYFSNFLKYWPGSLLPSSVLLGYYKLSRAQEMENYSNVNLRKQIIDTDGGTDIAIKDTDMEI